VKIKFDEWKGLLYSVNTASDTKFRVKHEGELQRRTPPTLGKMTPFFFAQRARTPAHGRAPMTFIIPSLPPCRPQA
jgi:hypothetical protein